MVVSDCDVYLSGAVSVVAASTTEISTVSIDRLAGSSLSNNSIVVSSANNPVRNCVSPIPSSESISSWANTATGSAFLATVPVICSPDCVITPVVCVVPTFRNT